MVAWPKLFGALQKTWNKPVARAFIIFLCALAYLAPVSPVFATTPNPPTILNPGVFSYENTTPSVDGVSGALTQSISIDIPPGRNGMQPDLSLNYNSQDTDEGSIVGYGWSLSIPYIERINKTGSQDLYNNPYFSSSFDGELTQVGTTSIATTTSGTATVTVYTTGGDGDVQYWNTTGFGTAHNASSGTSVNTSATVDGAFNWTDGSAHWVIGRMFLPFDTTGIPAGSIIDSATLHIYGNAYVNGGNVSMIESSQASAGSLSASDYGSVVFTKIASDKSANDFGSGSMQSWDLNSTGNSYINPGGITKIGIVTSYDFTDTDPGGGFGNNYGLANIPTSRASSNKPYLTITYEGTSTNVTANVYQARVNDGSFRKYTYATSTNSWTMYDKKGNEYIFGDSAQSQQSATSSPDRVYKWMLEKEIDPNGNYVRYVYSKDGNQIYPYQIIYTGHSGSDGPISVTFATSTRLDTVMSFASGFEVDTNYRISQITASMNGSTLRQYNLSYTTGNNGYRSLLSAVQESGWNESGATTTLPAWTFSYMSSTTPFVLSMSSSYNCNTAGDPNIAAPVLGDGLNRAVGVEYNGFYGSINISNDPSSPLSWPNTNTFYQYVNSNSGCPQETGTRLVDVAGNGMANIVQNVYNTSTATSTYLGYYANTGGAWSATTSYNGVIPQFYISAAGTSGIFGNINGTGLPSYEQDIGASGVTNGAYLPNGSAWKPATTTIFAAPKSFPSSGSDCTNSQLVDVNGDGLDDWVWTDGVNTYVDLNNGTGWNTQDSRWTISTSTVYSSGGNCYDRGMRFVDVNGDGLIDFIRSYTNTGNTSAETGTYQVVYLNTGHGWTTSTAYSLPYVVTANKWETFNEIQDNELANYFGNGQQYQDVLATTTNPKGGSTSVTYGYTAESGTNPKLPYNLLVVTKVVNHDGRGSNEETDYAYSGGRQYLPSNVFDRKFAGFASVSATTSIGATVTYYDQGSTSTAIAVGDLSDGYAQLDHPYRKDVSTLSNTPVQKTFYKWDAFTATSTGTTASSSIITFDNAASSSSTGSSHTLSFTVTCATNDASLVVFVDTLNDTVAGVTWNGTSMTRITATSYPGVARYGLAAYLLNSATTGTHSIIVTTSGSVAADTFALSYCGTATSSQPDAYTTLNQSSGNTITGSLSTNTANDWTVIGEIDASYGPTAGTSTVERVDSASDGAFNGDSGTAIASVGTTSLAVNLYPGTGYSALAMLALKPDPSLTPTISVLGPVSNFVYLSRQVEQDYDSQGNHRDKATEYKYSTTTGDLIEEDQYGEVTGSSDGTFTDTPNNDGRLVTYTYASSTSTPNLSALIEKKTSILFVGGTTTTAYFYTSGNGDADVRNQMSDFSTIRNGSVGTAVETDSVSSGDTNWNNGSQWAFTRMFLPFDTSAIPSGATINSATLYVRGHAYVNGGMISLIPSFQASSTSLATSDYGRVDFNTQLAADKNSADWGTSYPGSMQGWSLNSTGLSYIKPASSTDFAIVTYYERTNTSPGLGFGNNYGFADIYTSRASSDHPYLQVTYTTGGGAGSVVTDTKYYYDSLVFGSVGLGNQTREEDLATSTTYASSTKAYNSYGLIATSTDRNGNATAYLYDSFNLYPATTTNAFGQSTFFKYNYSNGKVATSTDPNGLIVKNLYDGVGRLTETDQSDTVSPSTLVTKVKYQFTDNSTPPSVTHESDYLNSATTTDTYDYYDGLGRVIQEWKTTENSNISNVKDFIYNSAGLLSSESFPYFVASTSPFASVSTSSVSLTPLNVLVIGGGGGGGGSNSGGFGAGGGGAGGYQSNTSLTLAPGTYSVTVGSGGSAGSTGGSPPTDGGSGAQSVFDGITASGGGGGGMDQNAITPNTGNAGHNGGSGGGGGGQGSKSGGTGTAGQGSNGGSGGQGASNAGGGGGGSGSAGSNGAGGSPSGGNGGSGTTNSITGTSVTYSCGGGGGYGNGLGGSAGCSNAGAGGNHNGVDGTGGGGGGSANGGAPGKGGSGTVIIAYPTAEASYYTCGGSTTTFGSNTICTFTSSGSFTESSTVTTSTTTYITASTVPSLFTNYTYDPLGRKLTNANAVGTTTNTYAKWTTTTTDPNGNIKDEILDAFGNLAQVVEHNTSGNATTTYSYDAANNLATTTDAAGNIRTFTYDGLGNRLSATDLHTSGAGSYGTWTYSYDDQGNEISRTDPKSQTITHTYDALNRMLTESWTGHGTQITNTYDSCTNGIGHLCVASSTGAVDSYAYDVLGRQTVATTTIAGTSYATTYSYDRQGNVTKVTNTNGSQVLYTYNSAGQVGAVNRSSNSIVSLIASLLNYAPTNQLGQVAFASGASTTYSYNSNALYRLSELQTRSPATTTASSTSSTITNGIISYWKFDESSGTTASDSVGSNSGTVQSGTSFAAGEINNGITQNSASGVGVDVGSPSSLDITQYPLSVSAWFKTSRTTSVPNGTMMIYTTTITHAPWDQYTLEMDPTTGKVDLNYKYGGPDHLAQSGPGYNDGNWHFVVGTIDSSGNMTLYIDGSSVGTGTATGGTLGSSKKTAIGINWDIGVSDPWYGSLDEIGVWNRDLSSSEVTQLYHSGTGRQYPFGTGTTTVNVPLQDFVYTYDADGNILYRTDNSTQGHGQVVSYSYDKLNRMISAIASADAQPTYVENFTYDALGNILTKVDATTTAAAGTQVAFDTALQQSSGSGSSITQSYTTGTGPNRVMVVSLLSNGTGGSSQVTGMTYNGTSLTKLATVPFNTIASSSEAMDVWYLINPSSGTHNLTINFSSNQNFLLNIATYVGASQSSFPDTHVSGAQDSGTSFAITGCSSPSCATGAWTGVSALSQANVSAGSNVTARVGNGTSLFTGDSNGVVGGGISMGTNISSSVPTGGLLLSIAPLVPPPHATTTTYTYGSTGYANPDAVTSLSDGLTTTTYSYDQNGNLVSTANGATTTTYAYDYANRLVALGVNGATTTYAYDPFGSRVSQTTGSTTTLYPSKYFSVVTTLGAGTSTTATSTEYIFAPTQGGDTLLATIDQPMVNGVAVGSTTTRYIHPDNLGSTNVTSDENGNLAQWFDYMPYGSVLASTNTGTTTAARQYIGQFSDPSGLSYLNARYYNPSQGQYLSQDPVFLNLGDRNRIQQISQQQQDALLTDPQSLNSYSYSENNPIIQSDPSGKCPICVLGVGLSVGWAYGLAYQHENDIGRGQTSDISTYVNSGVKGIVQGGATAASIVATGPETALQYLNYYETGKGLMDYYDQVLSPSSVNYSPQQQNITGGLVFLDFAQRVASAYTKVPTSIAYDAVTAVLNSLIQISNQYIGTQNFQSANTRSQTPTVNNQVTHSTSGGGSSQTGYNILPGQFNPFAPHS